MSGLLGGAGADFVIEPSAPTQSRRSFEEAQSFGFLPFAVRRNDSARPTHRHGEPSARNTSLPEWLPTGGNLMPATGVNPMRDHYTASFELLDNGQFNAKA